MVAATSGPVIVVGGGLAGCMIAIFLGRRGADVHLLERSEEEPVDSHLGASASAAKRSINLALSHRGRAALRACGLEEEVMAFAIPMYCRAMHATDGALSFQPYGTHGEAIYSVSRGELNKLLMDRAAAMPNVTVHRGATVRSISRKFEVRAHMSDDMRASIRSFGSSLPEGLQLEPDASAPGGEELVLRPRLIVGADGAYSSVRTAMLKMCRADFSRMYIKHGYKELTIPPNPETGDFWLADPEALHIWPRGAFMMIALPNPDKSFTCTIFAPYGGEDGFDSLTTEPLVKAYFLKYFPDAVPFLPDYMTEFFENPTGALVTTRVNPWHHESRVVLVGDSAHAVVPFYGQGMNCAFEDCLFFDEVVERNGGLSGLEAAVAQYAEERRPAGDALAKLSFDNYVEMRDHTGSALFLLRKRIEAVLHAVSPKLWTPLYTMVAFSRTPYHLAIERSERQDRWFGRAVNLLGVGALVAGGVAMWAKR